MKPLLRPRWSVVGSPLDGRTLGTAVVLLAMWSDGSRATAGSPEINPIAYWGGRIRDIDVVGDTAYIAQGSVLRILNIADPANIVDLSSFYVTAASGVRVRDGYAYVAAEYPQRFCVVNVSNPLQPTLAWNFSSTVQCSPVSPDCHPEQVLLYGNIAYVRGASGSRRFEAWDITDPTNVIFQGQVISPNNKKIVQAAQIVGDRLYVACDKYFHPSDPNANPNTGSVPFSFRVYDLSANPLAPTLLGAYYHPIKGPGNVYLWYDLAVAGDYAFVTARIQGANGDTREVWAFDVSNPQQSITLVDSMITPDGGSEDPDIEVAGAFAYVETGPGFGVRILDISNPAAMALAGSYLTHGSVSGMRIIANRAHLFDAGEGLIITDIATPVQPVRLGNYHSPAALREMVRVGDLLYVADVWNGFTILDVSDPAHPEVEGVYLDDTINQTGVDAWGIKVQNNLAYLGAGWSGLQVVDVSNPSNPTLVDGFGYATVHCRAVTLAGNTAYVSSNEGFRTLNITDPLNITQIGFAAQPNISSPTRTIEVNPQGIAFLSNAVGPCQRDIAINATNPANPFIIYQSETGPIPDLELSGDFLYLVCDSVSCPSPAGLYVRYVQNPAIQVPLAYIGPLDALGPDSARLMRAFALDLNSSGNRLYVAGQTGTWPADPEGLGWFSVYLFDVSEPTTTPVFLDRSPEFNAGWSSENGAGYDVLVDEPHVYLTASDPTAGWSNGDGLIVYHVDNLPGTPGDVNGDGAVNVLDLLAVISAWGPCAPPPANCAADLDGNGSVGIGDLLFVIAHWG